MLNMSLGNVLLWLVTSNATYVLCGAILTVALVWGVYAQLRIWRARQSLKETVASLSIIKSERDFTAAFEGFNEKLSYHPLLGHAWTEFADTLILPTEPSDVCRNSEAPELFFNAETVAAAAVNLRLLHAMPNYLTGFGILGTFIGLAAGIYLANTGLASQDIDVTRSALAQLLGGAGLAFTTSIVGLGSSIALSITDKMSLRSLDEIVSQWNTALDRCLKRATPEQLAAEQLGELRKQSLQLERFNTDLAVSIAEALDNRISQSLFPKFNELVEGLRELKGQQVDFSNAVLDKITAQLTGALSGAAGTEMREMATTLRGLVDILREAASILSAGQQQMIGATDGLVGRIQETFSQSATQMSTETIRTVEHIVSQLNSAGQFTAGQLREAGEESSRRFSDAFVSAENSIVQFDRSVGNLTEAIGHQREITEKLPELLEAMKEAQDSLRGTVDPLVVATRSLSSAGGVLSERLSDLGTVVASLKQIAVDVTSSQRQLSELWQAYEQRFSDVDTSLERAFHELNDGLDSLSGRVKQFMQEIDQSLGKSVSGLSSVAAEILEGVDSLQNISTRSRA